MSPRGTSPASRRTMNSDLPRNLGVQPIASIMAARRLTPHDLVANSTEQLTHKMVARAMKGRRLTANIRSKILHAINNATGKSYLAKDIFNYVVNKKRHDGSNPRL